PRARSSGAPATAPRAQGWTSPSTCTATCGRRPSPRAREAMMRAEAPGARTWVLGAVALWALATWTLGLFGLGGRVDRLPPDPELVQALPAAVQPGDERLGPLAQYAELGDRPMFTTDRRPQPFFINPQGEEAPAEFEYVLTSILLTPGLGVAIVQPTEGGESLRLKVGESAAGAPGWQLASLTPRSAVFDGQIGRASCRERVEIAEGAGAVKTKESGCGWTMQDVR